ncbi:MAG: MmgE/PrpD family protein [Nitrospirae bacterium]|nr:MmgE/PrpD family protein [Nitrospirota bacterium]
MKMGNGALIDEMAEWVAGVRYADIPPRVCERIKVQSIGMLGAAFGGLKSEGGRAALSAVRKRTAEGAAQAPDGDSDRRPRSRAEGAATIFPTGEKGPPHEALFANTALSMTFDYDDYLYMGHTGHSAIFSPWAVCEGLGRSGEDFLLAAAVANEVEGRIGATVLLGPHNGQLWSFIHAVGTACAAAKLMGLNAAQIRNAIGISLYLPPFTMMPGFMGPSSKVTTAAFPSVNGLRAAELAAEGLTGAGRLLEDRQGFLRHFSFIPLPRMLSGWGKTWVTDSLSFKAYPGCAYVSSIAEALRASLRELGMESGLKDPAEMDSLRIRVTLLTLGMDGLSAPYLETPPSSIHVNFSAALSAAVTLLNGDLRPDHLSEKKLKSDWPVLSSFVEKTRVEHDWEMTVELVRGIAQGVNLAPLFTRIPVREWISLRKKAREQHHVSLRGVRPKHIWRIIKTARGRHEGSFRRPRSEAEGTARGNGVGGRFDLANAKFEDLRMNFASEVEIRLKGGRSARARVDLPPGSSGRPWQESVDLMAAKLDREAAGCLSAEKIAAIREAVMGIEKCRDLRALSPLFKGN